MKYEIMFIVRPNLEEDAVKKVAAAFEKVLTDNGATITSTKDLGQKELAYEINTHKTTHPPQNYSVSIYYCNDVGPFFSL